MSGTDIVTQRDYQAILPDSVALVLDPFRYGRIEFKFFRLKGDKAVEVPYVLLVR
jgi:hypothetical protein